jgi:hypothetical protein
MVFSRGFYRRAFHNYEEALAMRSAQWVAFFIGATIGSCATIILIGFMRDLADWWRGR